MKIYIVILFIFINTFNVFPQLTQKYSTCSGCSSNISNNSNPSTNYTYGVETPFTTIQVGSDFGPRYNSPSSCYPNCYSNCLGTSEYSSTLYDWHGGVDISLPRGTGIVALENGTIERIDATGVKGIVIQGSTLKYGYRHIFHQTGYPSSSGMRSGDFILKQVNNSSNYAIIVDINGVIAYGTNSSEYVNYNGVNYPITSSVSQGDLIAPVGNSNGNYGIHLHIQSLKTNNNWSDVNAKNPLKNINHIANGFDLEFLKESNFNSSSNFGINIDYSTSCGTNHSPIFFRAKIKNSGVATQNKYSFGLFNIENATLLFKNNNSNNFDTIKGINRKAEISYGSYSNLGPKPSYVVSNNYNGHQGNSCLTGIYPYAYDDCLGYPWDIFYFTEFIPRIHKDHIITNSLQLSKIAEDSRYKEGNLTIKAVIEDVREDPWAKEENVLIDNFLPYIKKVFINGPNYTYSKEYVWNPNGNGGNGSLDIQECQVGTLNASDPFDLTVHTSEPMLNCNLSIFQFINLTLYASNTENTIFQGSFIMQTGGNDIQLTFDGRDLANNDLNSNPQNLFYRNGNSNTSWTGINGAVFNYSTTLASDENHKINNSTISSCSNLCINDIHEPNDATPHFIQKNGSDLLFNNTEFNHSFESYLCSPGDEDYFKFKVGTKGALEVRLSSLPADYDFEIIDNSTGFNEHSTNLSLNIESITFAQNVSPLPIFHNTVWVRVYAKNGYSYNSNDSYKLSFTWKRESNQTLDDLAFIFSSPSNFFLGAPLYASETDFPSSATITATNTDICQGESTQITTSGICAGVDYVWYPTNTLSCTDCPNPIATPTDTTTYTLFPASNNGLPSNESCYNPLYITINVVQTINADAGSDVSIPTGATYTLNGQGNGLYSWSPTTGLSNPNIADPIASPLVDTEYILTVTSGTGCEDTDTMNISVLAAGAPCSVANDFPCCADILNINSDCQFSIGDITTSHTMYYKPIPICDAPGVVDEWRKVPVTHANVSLISRQFTGSPISMQNDIGIAFYEAVGGDCNNLVEIDCIQNSLTTGGGDYMPEKLNISLASYIGDTVYMRIWNYLSAVDNQGDYGKYEMCLSASDEFCDPSIFNIFETTNISHPTKLGEDALVEGEDQFISWKMTATIPVSNAVLAMYVEDTEIYSQNVSVNVGDTVCFCPTVSETMLAGLDTGKNYTFRLVIENNTNNLSDVSKNSSIVCMEQVKVFTPQIVVNSLPFPTYTQGNTIDFKVQKNVQELLNLKVTNLVSSDEYTVTNTLPFDSASYNNNLGLCSAPTWTIPSTALDGAYLTTATSNDDPNIFGWGANFMIGTCLNPYVPFSNIETVLSTNFLCFLNLISSSQTQASVENGNIKLGEASNLVFRALYYTNTSAMSSVPSDDFPVPFQNLQTASQTTSAYQKALKALSYLSYQDFETALPRDYFFVDTNKFVTRKLAIRVLLEAFDIQPSLISNYYTDVSTNTTYANYINYAGSVGFVPNTVGTNFRPNDPITKEEFYNMLFRVMTGYNVGINVSNPNPTNDDYYTPSNHKPENLPYCNSAIDGHLNVSGGSAFGVKGKGLALGFAFSYSNVQSELPQEFYRHPEDIDGYNHQPLGLGWTHNYTPTVLFSQGDTPADDRYVFNWPNHTTTIYDGSNWVTNSNFDKVITLNSNIIEIESKSLMKYKFQRVIGQNYYHLESITDRYGNALNCTYTNLGVNSIPYLDKVTDSTNPSSNYLKFEYESNVYPPKLEEVKEFIGGSNNRTIYFEVGTSLDKYTDIMGGEFLYSYNVQGAQWKPSLTQVTLPKGNSIKFELDKNKLTKISKVSTYTTYNWSANYDQTSGFTECTTTSPQGYSTQYSKDDLGRLESSEAPTSHLDITSYGSGDNIMFPTRWTFNDLDYGKNYDTRGNVTSNMVLGSSTTIADSSSYNTKDQKVYFADAENNEYTYAYLPSDNSLFSITLPGSLGSYFIVRNTNGQITDFVNPDGIYLKRSINSSGFTEALENMSVSNGTAKVEFQNFTDYGQAEDLVDPNGNTSNANYRLNGQTDDVTNAIGKNQDHTFDANYNLIEIKNEKNELTKLKYTSEDWSEKYQFGTIVNETEYNDDGTTSNYKQGGSSNPHSYNNLLQLTYALENQYDYYNNNSHLLKEAVNVSHDITREFDYNDIQQIEEIETEFHDGTSKKVEYESDGYGNITYIYYDAPTNSKYVHFEYENDRCKYVYDWKSGTPLVEYEYHNDGRLKREIFRNGIIGYYVYDNGGRLTKIEYKDGNNYICSNYFGLDDAGLHNTEFFKIPNADAAFPYFDNTAQAYDPSPYNQAQGFTINGGNHQDIDVDNNGNITKIGNVHYYWDTKNMLIGIKENGTYKAQFKYNDANQLVHKRYFNHPDDIKEVHISLDINGNTLEENYEFEDGTTSTIYYITGPNGLICRHFGNATEYYHFDYRGNTLATTNQDKTITHSFTYNSYTGAVAPVRENQNYDDEYPFNRAYVARWGVQEEIYGLQLMGLRYQSETIQGFLNPDPVVWADNMYTYANNNPLDFVDPNGLLFYKASFLISRSKQYELLRKILKRQINESHYQVQKNYFIEDPTTTIESLENFREEFKNKPYNEIATGHFKQIDQLPIPERIKPKRYSFIKLSNGRDLDLLHFMAVGRVGMTAGYAMEIFQIIDLNEDSAFYPQDIYSNKLGVKFFKQYKKQLENNPNNISEYIYQFLSNPNNL